MSVHLNTNTTNTDIPFVPSFVTRPSIDQQLEAIRSHKVTLVSAPPGYGKTTVIAGYIRKHNLLCAWHAVEETDRDLPTLHQNALKALDFVVPGIGSTEAPIQSPHDSVSAIVRSLHERVHEHFIYVLDDVHIIAGSDQAEEWLGLLVELLPARCHLVLLSRTIPDIALAELISKGDVLAIGQEQLKFTREDVASLKSVSRFPVTNEDVLERIDQLEGWPAGLLLSIQPLPEKIQLEALKGQQGPEALFDTLAYITLQRQSPLLRDFLLAASVPSRITPEIAARLLDIGDSKQMLAEILTRNLFVHRVAGGLVFHRLFRNFLQRTFKETDPGRFRELHLKAGKWFRNENDYVAAFNHFVAAEAHDAVVDLVSLLHSVFFSQGRTELLLHWQNVLGEEALRIPRFVFTCAMIHIDRYMLSKAEEELEIVKCIAEETADTATLADVRTQQAFIAFRKGDYGEVIAHVNSLMDNEQLSDLMIGRAKHILAQAYLETGETDASIELLEDVLSLYESSKDSYATAAVLQDLDIAYTRNGDLAQANDCLRQLITIQRQLNSPSTLALSLNNLGYHYHQRGLYEEARHTFQEGLSVISQNPDPRAKSYLLWSTGDLTRDLGDFDTARQMYNSAHELAAGAESRLAASIVLSISTLHRWRGEYALAERLVSDAYKSSAASIDGPIKLLAQASGLAAAAFVRGPMVALQGLDDLLIKIEQVGSTNETALVATLAAIVALRNKDELTAGQFIDKALTLISPDYGMHTVAVEAIHFPPLLELVQRHSKYDAVREAAARLLKEKQHSRASGASEARSRLFEYTYNLRIYTLGQQTIERDGSVVPTSDWVASRARELFFYLLFVGPSDRQTISLNMWPDASMSKVRSNFHTTLYRIRQAVGEGTILHDDDDRRYYINPQIDTWCDAIIMENNVKRARLLSERDVLTEELYQKAIELYKGEFLPGLDSEWIDVWRRKLEECYIQSLVGAGKCAAERADYMGAIDRFEQALRVNPFGEEIYRELFKCLSRMGEHQKLVEQFDRMALLFDEELGVGPSQITIDLVNRLTATP